MRDQVARQYSQLIQDLENGLITPQTTEGYRSVWAQYSLLAKNDEHRAYLQNKLKEEGVPSAIYYPKPLHMQSAFENLAYAVDDFPVSYDFSTRIFSLPMHPYIEKVDQKRINQTLN